MAGGLILLARFAIAAAVPVLGVLPALPARGQPGEGAAHRGILEGVADAERIRDLILQHLSRSKAAGLGDEDLRSKSSPPGPGGWTDEHLAVLREIRDEARLLAAGLQKS